MLTEAEIPGVAGFAPHRYHNQIPTARPSLICIFSRNLLGRAEMHIGVTTGRATDNLWLLIVPYAVVRI